MGDVDTFAFQGKRGDTIICDLAARSLGSKASATLTLLDPHGAQVATSWGYDTPGEPLLAHQLGSDGRYEIRLEESLLEGSEEHYYRLSVGTLSYVTGISALSVPAQGESEILPIGYNLASNAVIKVKAGDPGEMEVPIDWNQFRARRKFKIAVSAQPECVELEPNDSLESATFILPPASIAGRIDGLRKSAISAVEPSAALTAGASDSDSAGTNGLGDADLYQFNAKAGSSWVIAVEAAQHGSPLDSKIEVLNPTGQLVQRLSLQAVRNSAVTFRGINSDSPDCRVENWEEMELNQFLYLQGEVVKLFRAPQGPDSGFLFYMANGKRRNYFDTSAMAHAVDEPCYIVEPQAVGARLVPNGLPVFPVYYTNDDDSDRKLGPDSKLLFTAPTDGTYYVRVSDTRGFGGERYVYRLVIREPKPDFSVTLAGADLTVGPGSGQAFSLNAERTDGFEGEILIEISGLPPGFSASTPVSIQAGHTEAKATLNAALDARAPTEAEVTGAKIIATATIDGRTVTKEVKGFNHIKLGEKPKAWVTLEPKPSEGASLPHDSGPATPLEITIAPGQTVPALLKVKRNGHDDLFTFTVENLPHGVIVDNIGLNGVLIPKEENEREIFLTAAKWVPDTDRLCYAVENQVGRQTSRPVWLRVRKGLAQAAAGMQGVAR
jgi:hypothetical protein